MREGALKDSELWFRVALIVLLLVNIAATLEAKELADDARSNAARALDAASTAQLALHDGVRCER